MLLICNLFYIRGFFPSKTFYIFNICLVKYFVNKL